MKDSPTVCPKKLLLETKNQMLYKLLHMENFSHGGKNRFLFYQSMLQFSVYLFRMIDSVFYIFFEFLVTTSKWCCNRYSFCFLIPEKYLFLFAQMIGRFHYLMDILILDSRYFDD